jgi:hypothetical protein
MKKLNINNSSIIYVACPANFATGGPEVLHQLVHQLKILNFNAFMYYYNWSNDDDPVHPMYKEYQNPYTRNILDVDNNILIVPEIYTKFLNEYSNIQKVIWWLSVDNYYKKFKSKNAFKRILKKILYRFGMYDFRFENKDNIFHFVQSEYALQHLKEKNISNIFYLSDYLNEQFINKQLQNANINRENIVVYNPSKGMDFTKKIIDQASHIRFIPLRNMTREQVAMLLSSAKVYIDFGNHPGKDRIPREASISGCCILTNKRGSAKYHKDVPIPAWAKYEETTGNILHIINKIEEIFDNYETLINEYSEHRKMIENERSQFIQDIKSIFTN